MRRSEAQAPDVRRPGGPFSGLVDAMLAWPACGWLLGSWLDERPRARPAYPSSTLRQESQPGSALAVGTMALGRPPHAARGIVVALFAAVVAIGPVAANRVPSGGVATPAGPAVPQAQSSSVSASDAVLADFDAAYQRRVDRLAAAWPVPPGASRSFAPASALLARGATVRAPLASAAPRASSQGLIQYRTQAGDALSTIAQRFSVSAMTVWWANDMADKDTLSRGRLLTLPSTTGVIHVVTDGDTLDSIAHAFRADADAIVRANSLEGGVVVLGQRLLIPGGHGPRYAPTGASGTLDPALIALRPRDARSGRAPAVGRALTAQPSAGSGEVIGQKRMIPSGAANGEPPPVAANDPVGAGSPSRSGRLPLGSLSDQGLGISSAPPDDIGGLPPEETGGMGDRPVAGPLSRAASGPPAGAAAIGPTGGTINVTISSPSPAALAPILPPAGGSDQLAHVVADLSGLFTTQFDGTAYANGNCNMASGAMLFQVQTGLDATGGALRAWSGATTAGTNLVDLQRAFASQGQPLPIYYDLAFGAFQQAVAGGRSAVVQGWYGTLPSRYDLQPGLAMGHSVFVLGYSKHALRGRGGFYVMDPLGRAGYDGEWWPVPVMRAYGWSGRKDHPGSDRLSWYGDVALQANRSSKTLGRASARPIFQSYWAMTKDAIEQGLQVTVRSPGSANAVPALRGTLLIFDDPRLSLAPGAAARDRALRWPSLGGGHIAAGFGTAHRTLDIVAPAGTAIVAAAAGRVSFRSWHDGHSGDVLWIQHGPRLFTGYGWLSDIRVKTGQWVDKGQVIGTLAGSTRTGTLQFWVSVGTRPDVAAQRVDPRRFLEAR